MKRLLILLTMCLMTTGAFAQSRTVMTTGAQTITGAKTFATITMQGGGILIVPVGTKAEVLGLKVQGKVAIVNNGSSSTDCDTGAANGTNVNFCMCNGSDWTVISGAGGGGDTTLAAHTDTNISSVAAKDILIWDGTNSWDNKPVSGDITIATTGLVTIGTDKIDEGMLNEESGTPTDGDVLTYRAASTNFNWVASTTGGWTDGGTEVALTDTTNEVSIGDATINSSKLSIGGDADQVQLTVQGHATQTDSTVIIENQAGAEVATIDDDGTISSLVGFDGVGAVDLDYGSADITDHTFVTAAGGDAAFVVPVGSIGSADITDDSIVAADINSAAAITKGQTIGIAADNGDVFTGANTFVDDVSLGDDTADEDSTITFERTSGDETLMWDEVPGQFVLSDELAIGGTGSSIEFEGTTPDAFETTLTVVDPTTPSKTITLPNLTGTVLLDTTTQTRSMYWDAGNVSADAAQCADATESANTLVKQFTIVCQDNDAGHIYGHTSMPDAWDGGTVTFTWVVAQIGASTQTIEMDFAAQCVSHSEALSAFATPPTGEQAASITLATDNDIYEGDTAAITVAGTSCAAGDTLFWTGQVDATASGAEIATAAEILGVKMEYGIDLAGD